MLDFTRLKTPAADGDVLIEPVPADLLRLTETNHALLRSYRFAVLDTDASEVRASLRRSLCESCDAPTVVTGHQPEFIHAGVWAKHVVASRVAERYCGRAINFVVDNDAPRDTRIDVPGPSESGVVVTPVRFAQLAPGAAHESIPHCDAAGITGLERSVRHRMGPLFDRSCMGRFFEAMHRANAARDWVDQVVFARQRVERDFGVEMIEHRVSKAWFGPLLGDLILNADRFHACYNEALSEYRTTHRVRSRNRPIADLATHGSRRELPVWVYLLGQARRRLFVERSADRVRLFADADEMGDISLDDLQRWDRVRPLLQNMGGYVFRPRALTLTLWARLFVGDMFIHGIGGAKYDRITDGLIRRYYEVDPPAMACVSATLLLDLPHDGADQATLRNARALARDLRCNPQRHVASSPAVDAVVARRAAAVARSERLRASAERDRPARRAVFQEIRRANAELLDLAPAASVDAERAVRDVQQRVDRNRLARRRDYFFVMHDPDKLRRLAGALASWAEHGV